MLIYYMTTLSEVLYAERSRFHASVWKKEKLVEQRLAVEEAQDQSHWHRSATCPHGRWIVGMVSNQPGGLFFMKWLIFQSIFRSPSTPEQQEACLWKIRPEKSPEQALEGWKGSVGFEGGLQVKGWKGRRSWLLQGEWLLKRHAAGVQTMIPQTVSFARLFLDGEIDRTRTLLDVLRRRQTICRNIACCLRRITTNKIYLAKCFDYQLSKQTSAISAAAVALHCSPYLTQPSRKLFPLKHETVAMVGRRVDCLWLETVLFYFIFFSKVLAC